MSSYDSFLVHTLPASVLCFDASISLSAVNHDLWNAAAFHFWTVPDLPINQTRPGGQKHRSRRWPTPLNPNHKKYFTVF